MTTADLTTRVEALATAITLADGLLPEAQLDAPAKLVDKARGRLRHGTDRTVVALAGPTGSGKSTLFNALCGAEVSATGVRRPTTGSAHACVWGDAADDLIGWLGVSRIHRVDPGAPGAGDLAGLVLVDLPDFDSVVDAHRSEVDRLIELVDLMVWVTDPQKYADEALHDGYLARLADHGDVMRFVLNKTDTVAASDLDSIVTDFERRIQEDGIESARVLPTAALSGPGTGAVRDVLVHEVAQKDAAVARLDADLVAAAGALDPGRSTGGGLSSRDRKRLVAGLGRAAGVDVAAALIGRQHQRDGSRAMAWPPAKWLRRRGRQPVADLPRTGTSAVSSAEVAAALRDAGEAAGNELGAPWPTVIRRTALDQHGDVQRALTSVTLSAARPVRRPRWWTAVAWLQRVVGLAALAGLAWLLVVAALGGFLRFDTDPLLVDTPGIDWIPLPSLLLVGGVVAGLFISFLVRAPLAVGGRKRARRARAELRTAVADVADTEVVAPLSEVLDARARIGQLLDVAAKG